MSKPRIVAEWSHPTYLGHWLVNANGVIGFGNTEADCKNVEVYSRRYEGDQQAAIKFVEKMLDNSDVKTKAKVKWSRVDA